MTGAEVLDWIRTTRRTPAGCRWRLKSDEPGEVIDWGTVAALAGGGWRYWPRTTPWNGRGQGEPPNYEWAVQLVRLPEDDGLADLIESAEVVYALDIRETEKSLAGDREEWEVVRFPPRGRPQRSAEKFATYAEALAAIGSVTWEVPS